MFKMVRRWSALALTLPMASWAGTTVPPRQLPEPETWALLAIAGVAAIVVAIRNKRK